MSQAALADRRRQDLAPATRCQRAGIDERSRRAERDRAAGVEGAARQVVEGAGAAVDQNLAARGAGLLMVVGPTEDWPAALLTWIAMLEATAGPAASVLVGDSVGAAASSRCRRLCRCRRSPRRSGRWRRRSCRCPAGRRSAPGCHTPGARADTLAPLASVTPIAAPVPWPPALCAKMPCAPAPLVARLPE